MSNEISLIPKESLGAPAPYKILKPAQAPCREDRIALYSIQDAERLSPEEFESIASGFDFSDPDECMALDIETKGNNAARAEDIVVGVGLSDKRGSVYFEVHQSGWQSILQLLLKFKIPLIAHNVNFDASFCARDVGGDWHNWRWCTFGAMKHLAAEGWNGQRWGLKNAQTELLGWPETNEGKLDAWLVENGYGEVQHLADWNQIEKVPDELRALEDTPARKAKITAWLKKNGYGYEVLKPNKAEMWRAPFNILGEYCAKDADSTYMLYRYVLLPAIKRFRAYEIYHREYFIHLVKCCIDAQLTGFRINEAGASAYNQALLAKIENLSSQFLSREDVAPHIAEFNRLEREYIKSLEPKEKFKKVKLGEEPPRYRKDGAQSKNWEKWKEKSEKPPEIRKDWLSWQEKCAAAESAQHFNLQSNAHKQWLFYTAMGFPVELETDSGEPATDYDAMLGFGDAGKAMNEYNEKTKEQGYVQACLDSLGERMGDGTAILNVRMKAPGTLTGRLAGDAGFNLQQQPKTRGYLENFIPREGKIWIDCYADGTEVLTKAGWIQFSQLKPGDLIWQVNKELQGSWTKVSEILAREHKGSMVKLGNHIVTSGHKILRRGPKGLEAIKAEFLSDKEILPATSTSAAAETYLPVSISELWTACLLQADGSIRKGHQNRWNLCLRKQRKIAKATELLGAADFISNRGDSHWAYKKFTSWILDWETKEFDFSRLSPALADELYQALAFWDGTRRCAASVRYFSTNENNIKEAAAYFAKSGYKTTARFSIKREKPCYYLEISSVKTRTVKVETVDYDGMVYCVQVPWGFLAVRKDGDVIISGNCDHSSLEPVVLTELSGDPAMLRLFGRDAPPNDVYLYTAAHIPGLREGIIAQGYNPLSPSTTAIAQAKKNCKAIRSVAKVVYLASSYGAGPGKIQKTLKLEGIHKEFDEVKAIHRAFWQLYAGIKEWERFLMAQYERNGGWVLNGIGRPIAIDAGYTKDICNRVVQSTGHDIHMIYIKIVEQILLERGIEFTYIIPDWHDEIIIEVDPENGDRARELMNKEAFARLNEILRPNRCLFKGDANLVRSLAEAKCEG